MKQKIMFYVLCGVFYEITIIATPRSRFHDYFYRQRQYVVSWEHESGDARNGFASKGYRITLALR